MSTLRPSHTNIDPCMSTSEITLFKKGASTNISSHLWFVFHDLKDTFRCWREVFPVFIAEFNLPAVRFKDARVLLIRHLINH